MIHGTLAFLRRATPFLTVLFLWRLAFPFWNPAGMLAIIPIFYSTFVRPAPWFAPFALIFCFLIDYRGDSVLYWTAIYCLCYAVRGFQNVIDFAHMENNGMRAFVVFWGMALLVLTMFNPQWSALLKTLWLFVWGGVLYIPVVKFIERMTDDR